MESQPQNPEFRNNPDIMKHNDQVKNKYKL